jgi:hypothetical protein
VLVTAYAWNTSSADGDAQAALVWVLWFIIDLPVSFLSYELTECSPLVIHGIFGTLWWYFVALVVVTVCRSLVKRPNQSLERGRDG